MSDSEDDDEIQKPVKEQQSKQNCNDVYLSGQPRSTSSKRLVVKSVASLSRYVTPSQGRCVVRFGALLWGQISY